MMFQDFSELLNHKAHRIITKRLEPYDVIESVKKFYDVVDYTFNGRNKFEIMDEFINSMEENSSKKPTMGLYMKNVNKFYLLTIKENPQQQTDIELLHNLLISEDYGFSEDEQLNSIGITYSSDIDFALEQIDMGKAEASFVFPL